MRQTGVFFDLDGTLLDTAQDLCAALDMTMIDEGVKPLPFEATRPYVSNGSYALIEKGLGISPSDPKVEPIRERLLAHYLDNLCTHTRPFDGIDELITTLAANNIPWGIITNKPSAYAEPLMEHFSFASSPGCLICPDHVTHRKPDPEAMFLACDQSHCCAEDSVYIGDHKRDIECGNRAQALTIAVSYGYLVEADDIASWGADHIVDSAREIWPLINQHLTN
jgi:phosphoglycolate phosphatase